MLQDLKIGTAHAPRGTVARGAIPVGTRAGGHPIEIPLLLLNGFQDGRVLWIDGAIHGDEPEGPLTIFRLMQRLDPAKVRGAVVAVPVVNVGAFESNQRGNPADLFTYDLNRIYPGRPDGHLTERIAHAHYTAMVAHADLEVSIHSGGAHSYLAHAQFYNPTPEGLELAKAMGPEWDLLLKSFSDRGSPMAAMKQHGKAAITVELGGMCDTFPSRFRANGESLEGGILNIMRHYGMIDGAPRYATRWMVGQQKTVILAPASGFWLSEPEVLRQRVTKDTLLARILSVYGDVAAEIKAPYDGIPFGLRTNPTVQLGDWCVFYGVIEEEIAA
ncbi:MAG: succinylglutamate desuccinylase/aspartoacylase family protein [bacterium]